MHSPVFRSGCRASYSSLNDIANLNHALIRPSFSEVDCVLNIHSWFGC